MPKYVKIYGLTFKDVKFDNEFDCRWAVFFETLGLKWRYKMDHPFGVGKFGPTFKVQYPGGNDYAARTEWFYTYGPSDKILSEEFLTFSERLGALILLDSRPLPVAYPRLHILPENVYKTRILWSFLTAMQSASYFRSGYQLWSAMGVPIPVGAGDATQNTKHNNQNRRQCSAKETPALQLDLACKKANSAQFLTGEGSADVR